MIHTRGFVLTDAPLTRHGPRRVQPIHVREDGWRHYAVLIPTNDGVLVRVCDETQPKGSRTVKGEMLDAPIHVIAEKLHALLADLNRDTP